VSAEPLAAVYQATCEETYVTLRIYPQGIGPEDVSRELNLTATRQQRKGDPNPSKRLPDRTYPLDGWFLSSEGEVGSTDFQIHLDWLLHKLSGREEALERLRISGAEIDVACFWVSANGNGGPTLSPDRAGLLARYGLTLWFDIYFGESGG
jgi:hypothetical protein